MDGKDLAGFLNDVSRGNGIYAYDEQSKKVFVIGKDRLDNGILSIEKATNELKVLSGDMLLRLKEIFMELVEDKPAGNGKEKIES